MFITDEVEVLAIVELVVVVVYCFMCLFDCILPFLVVVTVWVLVVVTDYELVSDLRCYLASLSLSFYMISSLEASWCLAA